MKNISLAEAKANIADLFDTVERGESVTINPDGVTTDQPSVPDEQRRQKARQAIEAIMEARKTAPRVTTDEILQWIHEGRR